MGFSRQEYWSGVPLPSPGLPAIPLLGIHTEETRRERDTSTPMFITALFIIARIIITDSGCAAMLGIDQSAQSLLPTSEAAT